jgi:DNA-binding NarL/FixJ family response regulator
MAMRLCDWTTPGMKTALSANLRTLHMVLVEDDPRYRASLETLFAHAPGFQLVASFDSASAACAEAARIAAGASARRWDVVLMDIDLGEALTGIEAVRRVKASLPDVHAIMVTVFEEPTTILQAICAGADGYLLKKSSARDILQQARLVDSGGAALTAGVARTMLELVRRLGPAEASAARPERLDLTDRERDVLRCLVGGMAYKEAADALEVSIDTVRSHIRALYKKLQVHGAAEAVARALREALV